LKSLHPEKERSRSSMANTNNRNKQIIWSRGSSEHQFPENPGADVHLAAGHKIQSKLITNEAAFLASKKATNRIRAGCLRGFCVLEAMRAANGGLHGARADDRYCDRHERETENPHSGDPFYGWGSRYICGAPNKKFNKKLPVYKARFQTSTITGVSAGAATRSPK